MPISAVVADYDLYLALDAALSSDPQDFSAIPHLTFYNPENADDNEFIEVIVGLLTQRSADDQTSRALLDHICIRSVVVDEINIIPDSIQNSLLLSAVNARNPRLLQCLAELKFNLGLKDEYGKDAFQGVAEQGVFRVGKKIPETHIAQEFSERESIRIILKSGQTELKPEALIDFVLFGLDRHLISLYDHLNTTKLAPEKNRFAEFFSPKNSELLHNILQEYRKHHPEKSEAVYGELDGTFHTFREILKEVILEEPIGAGAGTGAATSTAQPSNTPATKSESTSRAVTPEKTSSGLCAMS